MSLPTKSQRLTVDTNEVNRHMSADHNVFINGFSSVRQQLVGRHPLEALEKTYDKRMDNESYSMLKTIQGIHAPLKLIHERRAAQHVRRLPGLHSSNLMHDVLTGKDEMISPEDFLNDISQPEVMASTHMLCEKTLNIL